MNTISPSRDEQWREADLEARAAEAAALSAHIRKANADWNTLKNELAALINQAHGTGTWSRGYHLAHVEDADFHILSILEDVGP